MYDTDRCFKSFYKSAGFFLRKFYHADLNVKLLLFFMVVNCGAAEKKALKF